MNYLKHPPDSGLIRSKIGVRQDVPSVDRTQNTSFMVRCRLMNLLTQRCRKGFQVDPEYQKIIFDSLFRLIPARFQGWAGY